MSLLKDVTPLSWFEKGNQTIFRKTKTYFKRLPENKPQKGSRGNMLKHFEVVEYHFSRRTVVPQEDLKRTGKI